MRVGIVALLMLVSTALIAAPNPEWVQQGGGLIITAPACSSDRLDLCRSPQDKAKAEAEKREQEKKAAEAKRVQQKREAMVSEEMNRLGMAPHRRAEAERLADMRLAAEKARGGPARPDAGQLGNQPTGQDDAATAARKRREAQETARAQREKAEADAKKKHEEDLRKHLAAERAGIRMRALKCGGQDTITGIRPAVSPSIANCIAVHYEARCPGVPQGQGTRMVFYNFVGGNSCYGDTQKLSPPLACKAENAIVQVNAVNVCGF